jgi:hypothetical protein
MCPCIVSIFQYISNKMQLHTVYFIWKLLCMFRVVLSPIIRNAYNCIYSIWYLSHRYCYLSLSWESWNRFECAALQFHPNLHTKRSSIQSDIYQMSYWYNWFSWWWVHGCPKHAENRNKHTWKRTLRQVGYLQRLYRDAARSAEHKIPNLFLHKTHPRLWKSPDLFLLHTTGRIFMSLWMELVQ